MNHPAHPTSSPTEIVLHLVITFLTPMFLTCADGNAEIARLAAGNAVNAYAARNPTDLLAIAQVIAFGLAILDSLNRSMADDLPIALVLRLRANAASLGRLAEQCRRTLPAAVTQPHPDPTTDPEAERQHQAETRADLARTEQRIAAVQASFDAPEPPTPPAIAEHEPALPANPRNQNRDRATWAAAMTDVARGYIADLDNIPPAQRRAATTQAAILSNIAHELLQPGPSGSSE
jgi:hypothetical protein